MLQASVQAGESGPVVVLAGEADLTCAGQLDALIAGQLAGGTRQLTIDAAGLRFADSAAIRTLVLAARTLTERGGSLVLLDPQESVARVLTLLGADQMVTIGRKIPAPERAEPRRQPEATGTSELPAPAGHERYADEHGTGQPAGEVPRRRVLPLRRRVPRADRPVR
jgi:anti-anti-sigma factor